MNFTVSGNPEPNTTLSTADDNMIIQTFEGNGAYRVYMNVTCEATRPYVLITYNDVGNASKDFNISVLCGY